MPRTPEPITRRDFVEKAAASAALCAVPAAAQASGPTIVQGVPPYAVYDPLFESVRGALWKRGAAPAPAAAGAAREKDRGR